MTLHNAAPAPAGPSSASPTQQMAAEALAAPVDHRPPRAEARRAARVTAV